VATAEKTPRVLLPYAARSEASGNQAYYVLSTADFNDQSNLFEANGKVERRFTAIYAERYYQKIGSLRFQRISPISKFLRWATLP
jgi:hypothetical protein